MLPKPSYLKDVAKEYIDLDLTKIKPGLITLELVKRNEFLLNNFNKVRIWSVEHQAYWRSNSAGYTIHNSDSGIYSFKDAFDKTNHCDESKGITFEEVIDCKEFYNQPFEHEMITKYFRGWKLVSTNGADQEPHYSYNNNQFHLWLLSYRIIIEGENPSFTKKTLPPKTLQHFISDCERAELKLEWKND